MVQSNIIVTYAPARRPAAVASARGALGGGPRRVRMTLAGALLAGGAAFTLGTFVRPDGTIREPGTAIQPQPSLAAAERDNLVPSGLPERPVSAAPESDVADAERLPYLALVRDVTLAPAPALADAALPLAAPAPRRAPPPSARAGMRADRRPAPPPGPPAAAPAPHSASLDASITAKTELAPPPPAPTRGLRRDLEGFLGEQGLVLAADAGADSGIAPVSEWDAADFAADDAAPSLGAAAPPDLPVETASPQNQADISSEEPIAHVAALALTAEAADDLPIAEAVPSPQVPPTARASAERSPTTPRAAAHAETVEPVGDRPPAVAVLSIAPMPASLIASARMDPAQVQSYPVAVVNGEPLGAITLRDLGAQGAAVHLRALVELLKLRMPEAEFMRLSTAAAADRFVTFDELRAAGIGVRHDPRQARLFIEAR